MTICGKDRPQVTEAMVTSALLDLKRAVNNVRSHMALIGGQALQSYGVPARPQDGRGGDRGAEESEREMKDGYYWVTTYNVPPPKRPKPVGGITGNLQRRTWVRAYNAWLNAADPFIAEAMNGCWPSGSCALHGTGGTGGYRVIAGPLEPPRMYVKINGARQ